ncbi:MAG TPA: ABC transporter ATP-binding protein [Candidatus Eisenbacteria bacterium]|jgi:simple sugar transport system ATP-binding protein
MPVPAVALRGITRRFGPVLANDDVSLELAPGEIHALVGENGAGKTTLMRVLYGMIQPDAGTIEVDGRPARIQHPADAMRLGLGMVHQHFMLVDPLTVAENVTLGYEPRRPLGGFDRARAELEVNAIANSYHLPVEPRARVDTLPVGAQQRVEILKALRRGARVLILDEPTAVLTPQEVDELFGVLRALRDQGATIVLITHKLAEVKALAHRVTVMRAGRVVGGGTVESLSVERIAELMVGHPVASTLTRGDRAPGEPALEARDLWVRDERGLDAVRGVSFAVRAGEIVGVAGVEGNGQRELVECLAGLRPAARGEVRIGGRRPPRSGARAHLEAGLAHIPSDRLKQGLVPEMTLAENLVLGLHHERALGPGPFLAPGRLEARARRLLAEFDVRPAEPGARASQLSGGNQQKLIAARELSRGARAVIAAHPTRGVDLGAVAFLHARLLAERDAGRAVLLLSSELSEILALSDRILVLFEGRIAHQTTPRETDERALGLSMTGRSAAGAA